MGSVPSAAINNAGSELVAASPNGEHTRLQRQIAQPLHRDNEALRANEICEITVTQTDIECGQHRLR